MLDRYGIRGDMSTTGYASSLIQLVNVWSSQEARKTPKTFDEIRERVAQSQLHLVAPEISSRILPARNILPLPSRLLRLGKRDNDVEDSVRTKTDSEKRPDTEHDRYGSREEE